MKVLKMCLFSTNRFVIIFSMCLYSICAAPAARTIDNTISNYDKITHQLMPQNMRETLPGVLDITKKLTKLYLSGKQIRLTSDIFTQAEQLEMIDLSNGEISEIESQTFYETSKLRRLNLSGNRLKTLPANVFGPANSLKELDLADNQIDRINRASFNNMQHLKKLDLRNNKLTNLSGPIFGDLINLQELDLTGNPIKTMDEEFFASLPAGLALNFDDQFLDFKSAKLVDQWSI